MRAKKLGSTGWKVGVGIVLLALGAITAKGDQLDDFVAKSAREHAGQNAFITPKPPYPLAARYNRITGSLKVRVNFTAKGNVEKVVIEKSSGSAILDENSLNFIKRYWRSCSGKRATCTLPLAFVLR